MYLPHLSRTVCSTLAVLLLLGLAAPEARAGDFIDTRITFTLGDDNFLKSAGEQVPDSPRLGIGDRAGYELFFDNLDIATTGRENQLRLVLYKKVEGIIPGLTTEAAAAMRMDLTALEGASNARYFADDSSYIRLAYALDKDKSGKRAIDLVLFPLSGDRFRVGYLYDLTWGGTNMFPKRKGPTPAFKLGGNHGRFYWWAGMKMVLAPTSPEESANDQQIKIQTVEHETVYSGLAGIGLQPIEGLSIDFSGGHVQMGWNMIKDVAGKPVTATGFSARLAYARGLRVGLSADLRLLRNDPEYLEALSQRPTYNLDGKLSWRVALEGNTIGQVLADPDIYGATTRQWASAAAFDIRLQRNYLRMNLTALYRSLEFALLNTPSFVPYQAFSEQAIVQPQIFAAVAADYYFPRFGLMPGLQGGIELPAAVKTELFAQTAGSTAPATLIGEHTMLVRKTGERIILPRDKSRMPIVSVRPTLRWFASDYLTLLAFVFLTYDNNATVLEINADLTKSRVFQDPIIFGGGLTAQARF